MEGKEKLKVNLDLDTLGEFYDYCAANDIEFVVNGVNIDKDQGVADVKTQLFKQAELMCNTLMFKRGMKKMISIITGEPNPKCSWKEARGLLLDFFTESQQISADLTQEIIMREIPIETKNQKK